MEKLLRDRSVEQNRVVRLQGGEQAGKKRSERESRGLGDAKDVQVAFVAKWEQMQRVASVLDVTATLRAWKDVPFAWSVLVTSLGLCLFLVEWNQGHPEHLLMLDALPVSLLGVPVGFLLVFRSNNAYETWYSGLAKVHAILSYTKNMCRLATVWMADMGEIEQGVQRWTAAFLLAFRFSLRPNDHLCREALQQLFPNGEEAEKMMQLHKMHRIYYCISRIDTLVKNEAQNGSLSGQVIADMQLEIVKILEVVEGCELIYKNPIPGSYLVHLRRILYIYMGLLPFSLYKYVPPIAVLPVHLLLCFAVVGIEVNAAEIQEPFGNHPSDIPLDSLCIITLRDFIVMGSGYATHDYSGNNAQTK